MKKSFTLLTIVLSVLLTLNVVAQDTIVQWTFPTESALADAASIEINLQSEIVTSGGTSEIQFKNGITSKAAQATGWENGANEKKWKVEFSTLGYSNIKLSSIITSGGANPGPRDFKIQYRITGGNWTDIENSNFQTANDWTTGAVDNIVIPSVCNNQELINIRWIMTSDTATNNLIVASDGKSKIDNIFITGNLLNNNNELFASKVNIYPNPATNLLIVKTQTNTKISLYNSNGQQVISSNFVNNQTFDISKLSSGIYMLKIEDINNKAFVLKKIIIQ